MLRGVWIRQISFNLSRRIGRRMAASLAVVLLLLAGMSDFRAAANLQSGPASAQGRKRIAAQEKFDEAKALHKRQTADSLSLAEQKYHEALRLWREIGAGDEEATTLNNLGEVYDSLGEKRKALDFFNQALPLLRVARDSHGEANTLANIGYVYESFRENRKALDFYNKALLLRRADRDRRGEADMLMNIGYVYESLDHGEKALDSYNQALLLRRAVRDSRGEAGALVAIGYVYKSFGEERKALDFYNKALTLSRAAGDGRGEAKALHQIGHVYDSLGENEKAIDSFNQALSLFRAADELKDEAKMLRDIGSVYESMGEKRKAQDFSAQADAALSRGRRQPAQSQDVSVPAASASPTSPTSPTAPTPSAFSTARMKFSEGETLRLEGTVESLRLAARKYQEALPLWRAAGNRRGEAKTLNNLGVAYDSLREYQKAIDFYKQALRLWRAVGDRNGESSTLNNIGHIYYSLGEKQKALDFLNQALAIWRGTGAPDKEAEILRNIASVYESMGEKQKAQGFSAQADAALSRSRSQPAQDQEVLAAQRELDEAQALYAQGTNESMRLAAKKYEEALPLMRAIDAETAEAATLNNLGRAYHNLGERRKALDFYDQALPLWRIIRDRNGEATTLRNIGSIYNSLGEWRKALDFYDQALLLWRAISDRDGEAATLADIGSVYGSQYEWQKTLESYNRALSLFRNAGNRGGEASALNNIGSLYLALGEKEKALEFYNRALPLFREARDRSGEASTLANTGAAYNLLGEKRKALDFYNRALPLLREIGDRIGEVDTFNNIGAVYYSMGEYEKAADFYVQEIVKLQKAGRYRVREGSTYNRMGNIYHALGNKQTALSLYASALKWARALGQSREESTTLYNIARTNRALGHFNESLSQIESSLKIHESLRLKIDNKDFRATYSAAIQDHYKFYIDLLMQMHSREPASGYMAAALEVSERSRALSLIEGLTEARADIRRGADPKLIEQEGSLQQRLRASEDQALILQAKGADDARLAAHKQEIDTLTIELRQVQTQIRQSNPRYAALTQPQPLTLAEIQRQALDPDTLLLEYSLGEDRSFLWAVTPTTINSYILPKRDEIEAAAKRLYDLMSKSPGKRSQTARPGDSIFNEAGREYLTAAAGLSRTLLGPLAGKLGKKRLLIVADGMLHYVSFGALLDPNSLKAGAEGWQPLVVEHEIVNLPSATTLAVLRRELAGRKPAARTVAVLADPVFSGDDIRINSGARLAARQPAQPASNPLNEIISRKLVQIAGATSVATSGAAPGAAPRELRINRLPYTRQEAERIVALAPALALEALDFKASRATVMSGQLSQYRYVHFATHGLADSERPELSAIALSLYDEQGRPQEGFLRSREVYNLDLPAELVTLSACDTGLGKLIGGEGLMSLTRGFMYAGAARVVVSLWSVNDQATAELMEKFYRRMLGGGERPAAALRSAQVEMWREKKWEAPYYWAAFTLQGEWR